MLATTVTETANGLEFTAEVDIDHAYNPACSMDGIPGENIDGSDDEDCSHEAVIFTITRADEDPRYFCAPHFREAFAEVR